MHGIKLWKGRIDQFIKNSFLKAKLFKAEAV